MRLAIMQPYFIPYAGYYRLFTTTDAFVIYDDVQFPYPGWVHRNKLTKKNGELDWFTLPLKRKPLSTRIKDIEFAINAPGKWEDTLWRFEVFTKKPQSELATTVALATGFENPLKAILRTLDMTQKLLGIKCPVFLSSMLKIRQDLRGQDRVLAICEYFKATQYVNASGGIDLYDVEVFKKRGVELKILAPYRGVMTSILERLTYERVDDVKAEIDSNAQFVS